MYAIEEFLSNIQSYDSTYDKERFMEELQKVPNYQEVFNALVEGDKEWLALAEQTRDEKGLHIFYLLSYMALKSTEKEETELSLRTFSNGQDPTIKVLAKREGIAVPPTLIMIYTYSYLFLRGRTLPSLFLFY